MPAVRLREMKAQYDIPFCGDVWNNNVMSVENGKFKTLSVPNIAQLITIFIIQLFNEHTMKLRLVHVVIRK